MKKALAICVIIAASAFAQKPVPGSGTTSGSGGSGSGTVSGTAGAIAAFTDSTTVGDATAGTGIVIAAGQIAVDQAIVALFSTSAGAPSANCVTGTTFNTDTTNDTLYFCRDTDTWAALLKDSGGNGVLKRTAAGVTAAAGHADITALYGGGSCSGYLKSDGTCDTPAGGGGVDPIWLPAGHRNIASGSNITFWGSTAASGDTQNLGSNPNIIVGMGLADAADNSVAQFIQLPSNWTPGTLDVDVYWYVNDASTNSIRMEVSTACIGTGEAFTTPSYNTASAASVANGGNAVINKSTFTSVPITNCAAGERMWIKVARDGDGTGGTDDLAVTARFHGAMLRFN